MANCTIIKLKTVDQRLTIVQQPVLSSGDVGTVRVEYELDNFWEGYATSGTFFTGRQPENIYEQPLTAGACVVPWEVLQEEGVLYIGLRGADSTGLVKTAAPIRYRVERGSPSGNGTSAEPTPDVYQQLMEAWRSADAHVTDKNNPHGVTLEQLGAAPASHATDKNNPHGVTAEQIGAAKAADLGGYLPKAGATLPSPLSLKGAPTDGLVFIDNVNPEYPYPYIRYKVNGENKASTGYYRNFAFLSNEIPLSRLGINDEGKPQYWSSYLPETAKDLIHAGNVGSFAAPAGYGLGDGGQSVDSFDDITASGMYKALLDVGQPEPSTGWSCLHMGNDQYAVQNCWQKTPGGYYHVTRVKSTTWQPWEWVNPPLMGNVEYRTTKRWDNKVVYTKRINLGAAPAVGSSKTVEVTSKAAKIISITGIARSEDQMVARPLPAFTNDGTLAFTVRVTNQTSITLESHSGASKFTGAYNVDVVVEYVDY